MTFSENYESETNKIGQTTGDEKNVSVTDGSTHRKVILHDQHDLSLGMKMFHFNHNGVNYFIVLVLLYHKLRNKLFETMQEIDFYLNTNASKIIMTALISRLFSCRILTMESSQAHDSMTTGAPMIFQHVALKKQEKLN